MNLKHLTDSTLLSDIKMLVAHERFFLTKILHHLKEIEERKLFSDLKYASIFDYAVKELGYSDSAAMRRIHASRLLKQIPSLEKKIESGAVTLSNLSKAQRIFQENNIKDPEKKKEIIKKIENKSARQCEKELVALFPNPLPSEQIRPVTPDFNQMKINISDETLKLLEDAKSIMGFHQINNSFFEKLALEAMENIKRKRFKLRYVSSVQNPESRSPNAQTKRETFENSNGRCENCGSLFRLQFDHVEAFSLGGTTTTENLRLLCFHCNQRSRMNARL